MNATLANTSVESFTNRRKGAEAVLLYSYASLYEFQTEHTNYITSTLDLNAPLVLE